jgi:hypothetical protein
MTAYKAAHDLTADSLGKSRLEQSMHKADNNAYAGATG